MLLYDIGKSSDLSNEEKIELISKADIGELLRVVREFEDNPSSIDVEIIKAVSSVCFDKGLMLM